jgi:hypothetical protein
VTKHIHLVFSEPPAEVTDDEFNEWYDEHVLEILSVAGWEAAIRYAVEEVVGADGTSRYRYLSLYELSVPPDEAVANLAAASMGNADSYVSKKDADDGKLPLPPWFTGIRFGSWNCTQLGTRIAP